MGPRTIAEEAVAEVDVVAAGVVDQAGLGEVEDEEEGKVEAVVDEEIVRIITAVATIMLV